MSMIKVTKLTVTAPLPTKERDLALGFHRGQIRGTSDTLFQVVGNGDKKYIQLLENSYLCNKMMEISLDDRDTSRSHPVDVEIVER